MPDQIRRRFGYGQLWPLRPASSQNRPGSHMPDPTYRIRFSSVFTKKPWIILCKTDPDPFWTVWSEFGRTYLICKQAGVQESSDPVSGRTQPARYLFPTSRLGSVFPKKAWVILHKTDPDPIWMAWSGSGKLIWSGSRQVCRNHRARCLAEHNRPAISFPLLDSVPFFHRRPG